MESSQRLAGEKKALFDATVYLQAKIHYFCNQGAICFTRNLLKYQEGSYQESFYLSGRAAELFDKADRAMKEAEYGVWEGVYDNDCLTDIRFTAYMIRSVMRVIRAVSDDARLADWYEDFVRPKEDRKVRLLAITDHHMTDNQLFAAMKEKNFSCS